MEKKVSIEKAYKPSEDVVARQVQGEFIIIPITSGIGDLEDEIFTLNETGRAIWDSMDGEKTLKVIAKDLSSDFESEASDIEKDILGFTQELMKRNMLVEVGK